MITEHARTQKVEESTGRPFGGHVVDERIAKRAEWEDLRLAACPGANRVNVANYSHGEEQVYEHTYTVTLRNGRPVSCTGPAFQHQSGDDPCKHMLAVADAPDVIAEAMPEPAPSAVTDSGAAVAAAPQSVNDDRETCLFCHHSTESNPYTVHIRRPAGPNVGDFVAKGHICEDCLEDDDQDWQYNGVR